MIDAVENAILQRLPVCESFEPYHSKKERKYLYYKIYVKNYVVYYVVIDDEGRDKIMEVRRMLYNRQDRENIVWNRSICYNKTCSGKMQKDVLNIFAAKIVMGGV